jgi:UDP:flavonoid glycosyltransferase YjiC (YdhE family)
MIAVALRLREAGHQTVIAAEAAHGPKVEAEGLEFCGVRPDFADLERELGLSGEEIMRRLVRSDDFLFRKVLFPALRDSLEDGRRAVAGADLLVATGLSYGPRYAAELVGLPWIAAALQPSSFLSVYDPPAGPNPLANRAVAAMPPGMRRAPKRLATTMVNYWAAPAHELRRELGLPPRRDLVFEGQFAGAVRTLGLYSPLLGEVQPDFPPNVTLPGFCFYDTEAERERGLPAALERFLEAGPPPLVVSLGSTAVMVGETVYRAALAAARRLRRRAVLLVGADALPRWAGEARPDAFVESYAPHALLFPRACAVIHHGGAGSVGQALRAGRPQLIVPFMTDQPDNAARVVRLGAGRSLSRERFTRGRAASELGTLLNTPAYLAAARAAAQAIAYEDGPGGALQAVEEVLAGIRRRAA